MSDTNSFYKAVESLLGKADKFGRMTPNQQAGFRAQLTKLIKQDTDDPDMKAILESLQEEIGEPAKPVAKKMTADDILAEYAEKYAGYSVRERAAFKAKMSRLLKEARANQDFDTESKLVSLENEMAETELRLRKQRILKLAKGRKK